MRKIFTFSLLSLFLIVSGCIEITDEFVLNPDSSGKVIHKAVFQPMNFNLNDQAQPDPEKEMRKAVRDELTKSAGVETWKDVSYERTDDDRISFKGTAYFKNLADLKFHNSGTQFGMLIPKLEKEGPGKLTLKLENKPSKKEPEETGTKKTLSEAEIEKQIKAQRAAYNKAKPMMLGMLSTFALEQKYHLPGKLIKHANLKPDADGTLNIIITGEKLLNTIEELMKDDNWVRKQVEHDANFMKNGPKFGSQWNGILYGTEDDVYVQMENADTNLFDYEAEVAVAKKSYPSLIKSLGFKDPASILPAKEGGFKKIEVGGIQIVNFSSFEESVRPFNADRGFAISLIGHFSGSVLSVKEGRLETAISDQGENLLPDKEWDRKINFPRLSTDKTKVVFEIKMKGLEPESKARGLKELSGVIDYLVGSDLTPVDLGFTSLKAGNKGTQFNAEITRVGKNTWDQEKQDLELKLNIDHGAIQSTEFFDAAGKPLEVERSSSFYSGDTTTLTFSIKGTFPETGKIKISVFKNLQKFVAPFKLENISFTGNAYE